MTNEFGISKIVQPGEGSTWSDAEGRILKVTEVDLKDPQMSQVKGKIEDNENYSCTLDLWAKVWRDKVPSADPRGLKVG